MVGQMPRAMLPARLRPALRRDHLPGPISGRSFEPLPHTERDSRVMDSAPIDDAALVDRVRSGDREALGALYDRYASLALAVALRVVGDRSAAEDLVHDSFVAVWQKIARFDPARGSVRSWILAIVRNRAIDRVRANRQPMGTDEADELALLTTTANPTWDEVASRLSTAELRTAITDLPDEQRRAIELAYFGGRTYREIAVITGVPQGTANGRLRLALGKLRAALSGGEAAAIPVEADRFAARASALRPPERQPE